MLILAQVVVALFGIEIDLGDLGNKLIAIVNSAFVLLAILGIAVDPTTSGVSDSDRALMYDEPK